MAIPTKAKNYLMVPVADGGISQFFNMPGFSGYDSSQPNHNGLDIGWNTNYYCDILACQDGKVVQVINNDVSGSRGNGVVLQHDYEDGTHRWTGYIHLKNTPTVKVGQVVKQGDVIGVRGGSPYINGSPKYGIHLHLYVTSAVKTAYTWDTLKANVVDPLPLLYRSKKISYNVLVGRMSEKPFLEDMIVDIVDPVPRDPLVNQLLEKSDCLRVRTLPSTSGSILGYLKQNKYYNYYDKKTANGYDWYKIATDQWVAKTDTLVLYPAKTEVELLKEEIAKLEAEKKELQDNEKILQEELENAAQAAAQMQKTLEAKIDDLNKEKEAVVKFNQRLTQKIDTAVDTLTTE